MKLSNWPRFALIVIITIALALSILTNRVINESVKRENALMMELSKAWDFEILCIKKGFAKYDKDGNIVLIQ